MQFDQGGAVAAIGIMHKGIEGPRGLCGGGDGGITVGQLTLMAGRTALAPNCFRACMLLDGTTTGAQSISMASCWDGGKLATRRVRGQEIGPHI